MLGAALLATLGAGCSNGPAPVAGRSSLTLFETRRADGSGVVPSRTDPTNLALSIGPNEADPADQPEARLTTPDGYPVSLGQFAAANGTARVACQGDRTDLTLSMTGLMPGGLYTVWLLGTSVPFAYDAQRIPTFMDGPRLNPQAAIFLEPAGLPDGSEAVVVADADGRASYHAVHAQLSTAVSACLLEGMPNWFVVVAYHADGRTWGADARPPGAQTVAQLVFAFDYDRPVHLDPP